MLVSISKTLPLLALLAGLAALVLVGAPGPIYKFGMLSNTAFLHIFGQMLKYGAFLGLGAVGLGVIAIVVRLFSGNGALALALIGLVAGGAAFGFVFNFRAQAQAVPPIHDISTDTENPPQFVALVPMREAAGALNPSDYEGNMPMPGNPDETRRAAQLAAYPDIHSIFVDADPGVVSTAIMATIDQMGWELVEASTSDGRFEAVDTTAWYGFKDDVVVRMEPQPDGAVRIDVRSKSRIGISDVGANANRIRHFLAALQERVGG